MFKKLSTVLLSVLLLGSMPILAHADLDDDLDDLRGTNPFKDWRLIKNDTRRNIKAYDKRSDETTGVRSFKLDVIVDGSYGAVTHIS